MTPHVIRKIDYWLGIPLCFLLTLFRRRRTCKKSNPRKILFLKFIEQGATVLAVNAIQRAIQMVGKENVYFCVFENNRFILDVLNIIPADNIITLKQNNFKSFLISAFAALNKIRKEKIDTVIDCEFFSRASAIFSFLSGATIRIGLHRFTSEYPYRGDLMTHRVQYNPYLHISVFYRLLVEASVHNPSDIPMIKIPYQEFLNTNTIPEFIPTEDEIIQLKEKIKYKDGEKIVLLNPNASDLLPLRKWDEKKFIALGQKILESYSNVRLLITGSPEEKEKAEQICKEINSDRAMSMAGKTSLRELFVLYTLSDVLITNDSGPGHFSALTKIKTIILFGPETPYLFGPLSSNAHVIWKKLSCSPCVNIFNHRFSPCKDNQCMKSISVEEVYDTFQKIINDK